MECAAHRLVRFRGMFRGDRVVQGFVVDALLEFNVKCFGVIGVPGLIQFVRVGGEQVVEGVVLGGEGGGFFVPDPVELYKLLVEIVGD